MKVRWGRVIMGMVVLVFGCAVAFVLLLRALPDIAPDEITGGIADTGSDFRDAVGGLIDGDGGAGTGSSGQAGGQAPDAATGGDRPPAGSAVGEDSDLPPFRVLTLQYTPYMATLAHMDAGGFMERRSYDLQLVDVYDPEVDLDEEAQCAALQQGEYDALATTLDATRKCGLGTAAAIPIGQSAGNDAIVVKPDVDTWTEIFDHTVAFTGYSVSEYMACFASHTAAAEMRFPLRYDDASEAVDAWMESGVEQDIAAVVAWEPEVSRALASVPGSRAILSSRDVRILWDIVEFSTVRASAEPAAFHAFTQAYYEALLELTRDPATALGRIVDWADGNPAREALLTTTDPDEFAQDLELEAFATLRDAALLMEQQTALLNRLEEAGFYWSYCGVSVPEVDDLRALFLPEYVLQARAEPSLVNQPNSRPGSQVFQVTDFTNAQAVSDREIESAQLLFETGVDIEFLANRTDFRDPDSALATLSDAVRFLRTCGDCILEVQGSSAFPGGAIRRSFTEADADALAVARGQRVYDELRLRFDVPDAQLRFVETPRERRYPGSVNEEELRLDRRTYLTGYQLTGGM